MSHHLAIYLSRLRIFGTNSAMKAVGGEDYDYVL